METLHLKLSASYFYPTLLPLCPAPFIDKNGVPFLETHHIKWLSEGGDDSIQNTVALCPNCHRKMHSLNRKADINKLTAKAMEETI